MKKCLLLCMFIPVLFQANGQWGLTAVSTIGSTQEWQVVAENYITRRHTEFMRFGTAAALDYTIPLKNEALRIQPALQFVRSSWNFHPHYFEVYALGFQCNMNFALLPASNHEGKPAPFRPWLQVFPGLGYVRKKYDQPVGDGGPNENPLIKHTDSSLAFNAGANLLLEFRLTELLTVSPLFGVRLFPGLRWKNFTEIVSDGNMSGTFDRTHWRQMHFGLRVGLDL